MIDKVEMITMRLEGYTYQHIADKVGVSRQHIQGILVPSRATRDSMVKKHNGCCSKCGVYVGSSGHIHHEGATGYEDYNDIKNLRFLCIACHGSKRMKPPQSQCLHCGKAIRVRKFCSVKCFSQHHTMTLVCSWCGESYSILASQGQVRIDRNSSGLMYCSKKCFGEWFGNNHGFGTRPNHIRKKFKYDYEKIYQTQADTGFSGAQLSRLLDIPESTCYDILSKRRIKEYNISGG